MLYADRLGEQVERLARSCRPGRAAGEGSACISGRPEGRRPHDRRSWMPGPGSSRHWVFSKYCRRGEAALEQAFEIRLELRPVLRQLGEGRQMLEHLREAEALAERLKDDRRRGQVCAFMTTVLSTLNELDEALATGTRALEIAQRLGDLRLRILTTSYLEQAYYYRGEYERVVEFATDNLAALPAEWVHEYFGMAVPASIFGRAWLIMSLAELGRFAEAAKYEAEAIRTRRAHAARTHHRLGPLRREHAPPSQGRLGEGARADRALDHDASDRKCRHPSSLGGRLLRLGTGADRRGERGVEPDPRGRATPRASSGEGNRRSSRLGLRRA